MEVGLVIVVEVDSICGDAPKQEVVRPKVCMIV